MQKEDFIMSYHYYSKEELDRVFNTLSDLNNQGLLSGLGIFMSYAKGDDSSKPNFIKVGNISEMSILKIVENKIAKDLKKFSRKTADDMAS